MNPRSTALFFGTRKLSNLYCETCKAETLHVYSNCNHCGTPISVTPPVNLARRWNDNPVLGPKPTARGRR